MHLIKQIFNFYINASVHVALSVTALTFVTLIEFDLDINFSLLVFIFFASVTGYNFVKYFGVAKFHHRGLAASLKWIQVFSFFSFLVMCVLAIGLSLETLLYIFGLSLITFFYAIPFLPIHYFRDQKKNLRQISGLKIYVIALVWMFVTVVLPMIENEVSINQNIVMTCLQRYIFVILLMLPFEIRDLNYDSLKLGTIPQKIGVKRTKIMGIFLVLFFYSLEYFEDGTDTVSILATLVISFLTLIFIVFSNKNQSKYYSSFWVEGLPIVWLFILLMVK